MDSDPGDSNYIAVNTLDCAGLWTARRIQRKKEA